jgi:hypothetical protein
MTIQSDIADAIALEQGVQAKFNAGLALIGNDDSGASSPSGAPHDTAAKYNLVASIYGQTALGQKLAAIAADAGPAPTPPPAPLPSSLPTVLGAYCGGGNVAGVNAFAASIAKTVGIASDYLSGATWASIAGPWPANVWDKSRRLALGVPILPSADPSGKGSFAQGADGAYNATFAALAKNLIAAGHADAALRLPWEWDGSWEPWWVNSTTMATVFAAYYRQIVNTMRAVPGAAFEFSWYYGSSEGTTILNDAYPGDAYVDTIELDFYDSAPWASNLPVLTSFATFAAAHNKPLNFGEWGMRNMGDNKAFMDNFVGWLRTHPVKWASYFNFNSGGDSILAHYPIAQAELKTLVFP